MHKWANFFMGEKHTLKNNPFIFTLAKDLVVLGLIGIFAIITQPALSQIIKKKDTIQFIGDSKMSIKAGGCYDNYDDFNKEKQLKKNDIKIFPFILCRKIIHTTMYVPSAVNPVVFILLLNSKYGTM